LYGVDARRRRRTEVRVSSYSGVGNSPPPKNGNGGASGVVVVAVTDCGIPTVAYTYNMMKRFRAEKKNMRKSLEKNN